MPVLTIHIRLEDKQALQSQAEKRGLQLIPYCRMVLLDSINREGK
jgi:hypothetical protein